VSVLSDRLLVRQRPHANHSRAGWSVSAILQFSLTFCSLFQLNFGLPIVLSVTSKANIDLNIP
jgi:Sec-independent protein secretion pathway component TatC